MFFLACLYKYKKPEASENKNHEAIHETLPEADSLHDKQAQLQEDLWSDIHYEKTSIGWTVCPDELVNFKSSLSS